MYQNQNANAQNGPSCDHLEHQMINQPQMPPCATASQNLELAGYVHNVLSSEIQSNAQKSPIRIAMFNVMATNMFNNQAYATLLDQACELASVMMETGGHPQTVVMEAAKETILAQLATMVDSFPYITQRLSQQQHNELGGVYQARDKIRNFIHQYHQQLQQQAAQQPMHQNRGFQGGSTYGQNQRPGFEQPRNPGYPPVGQGSRFDSPPGGYAGNSNQSGSWQRFGGMGHQNREPQHPGFQGGVTHGQRSQRPSVGRTRSATDALGTSSGNTGGATDGSRFGGNKPMSSWEKPSEQRANPVSEQLPDPVLTQPNNKESDMLHVDDTTRGIGHLSSIAEVKEQQQSSKVFEYHFPPAVSGSHRVAFNPLTRTYRVVKVKEESSMNYEEHETNYEMVNLSKAQVATPRAKYQQNWADVTLPNVIHSDDTKEQTEKLEVSSPVCLDEIVEATSIDEAEVKVRAKLKEVGISDLNDRVVEFYAKVLTPRIIDNEDKESLTTIFNAIKEGTLTQVADVLLEVADNTNDRLWHYINDHFTAIFNHRVKVGLGSDVIIESFAHDYAEATDALITEDGISNVVIDRFKINILGQVRKTLFIEKMTDDVVYFGKLCSVTLLPWSSAVVDIQIDPERGYGLLSEASGVELTAASQKLLKRTSGKKDMGHRYIVTSDNLWIELNKSDYGNENVNITIVNQ